MTRISVAMTTYKGTGYVRQQLDSICAQSRPPNEIVVCDDHSQDETMDIVRSLLSAMPFQVDLVENQARMGVTANVEQAIQRTTGDIIVLADQDDVWYPNKLARLVRAFDAERGVGAVFSNATIIDALGAPIAGDLWSRVRFSRKRRAHWSSDPVAVLLQGNVVTGATLAFRSSLKPLLLPISPYGWHDLWIALMAASVTTVKALEEPLLAYRLHGGNTAGLVGSIGVERARRLARPEERDELLAQVEELASKLEEHPMGDHLVVERLRAKARHLMLRTSLPSGPLARASLVAQAMSTRQYHRYAAGTRSVLFDLLYGNHAR